MSDIEQYIVPHTLEDAAQAISGGDVTVFCGGTDLMLQTDVGRIQYNRTLMNIRRIDGLAGVEPVDAGIRIGALTTITEIMEDPLIQGLAPVLVETADKFASDQIRNAASIGGNLCNASPAGDMIIPLLVLDASVELASWHDGAVQTRLVALDQFFTGPGKTVKQSNELLTAVMFDKPAESYIACFRKSGPRPALEIATVSLGIGGVLENNCLHNVRVAMGSVAPTPLRARGVEESLEGKSLNAAVIKAAVERAGEDIAPIDDIRASAWYRDHLVRVFVEEVLQHVTEN